MCAPRWLPILGLSALVPFQSLDVAAAETVTIGNDHVRRTLQKVGGAWRTVEFSRADGSDALKVESDEFSALFFDDKVVTVADYESPEQPRVMTEGGVRKLVVKHVPREDVSIPEEAPLENEYEEDFSGVGPKKWLSTYASLVGKTMLLPGLNPATDSATNGRILKLLHASAGGGIDLKNVIAEFETAAGMAKP